MDANTDQLDEPTELEKKAMVIINKIQEQLVGEDIALVMSVMANLACVGIRSSADAQGIGCIGWAYRCADQFAEDVKGGLAKLWMDHGPPQPTDNPNFATQGNC
jgi:hypothetical protein